MNEHDPDNTCSKLMKGLSSLLAILTLVLIAIAMSKMAMYIGAYELSMRRLLPCIFMVFLAVICGGVVALQKWQSDDNLERARARQRITEKSPL